MSKYILNKTPVRTSINYNINDIEVDLDISNEYNFKDFKIISNDLDKLNINSSLENNFKSKIGLNFEKYKKLNININENISIENPIIIEYNIDNNLLVDEININLNKNSKCDFIIKYTSNNNCIHSLKQVLNTNENTLSNISIINLISNNSKSFISIESNINKNSKISYNFIDLGGNVRISNYYSKLNEENATNNLNALYFGKDEDRIDMNYHIQNIGQKTNSKILVSGSLNDNSYKTFKGTIDFIKGCKKSVGAETEDCILLSDTCKTISLPMLLCHEEDVEGAHGVSTGKIDQNKLFYLMSRGITEKEASKLIINASYNKIIEKIPNIDIQNEIKMILNNKIK